MKKKDIAFWIGIANLYVGSFVMLFYGLQKSTERYGSNPYEIKATATNIYQTYTHPSSWVSCASSLPLPNHFLKIFGMDGYNPVNVTQMFLFLCGHTLGFIGNGLNLTLPSSTSICAPNMTSVVKSFTDLTQTQLGLTCGNPAPWYWVILCAIGLGGAFFLPIPLLSHCDKTVCAEEQSPANSQQRLFFASPDPSSSLGSVSMTSGYHNA